MSPSSERTARSQEWLIVAIVGATIAIFVFDSFFPLGFVVPVLYLHFAKGGRSSGSSVPVTV